MPTRRSSRRESTRCQRRETARSLTCCRIGGHLPRRLEPSRVCSAGAYANPLLPEMVRASPKRSPQLSQREPRATLNFRSGVLIVQHFAYLLSITLILTRRPPFIQSPGIWSHTAPSPTCIGRPLTWSSRQALDQHRKRERASRWPLVCLRLARRQTRPQ